MSVLSFLRKFGETEDPLFKDLPVETPPPDEGQAEELQKTQNLATWEDEKYG